MIFKNTKFITRTILTILIFFNLLQPTKGDAMTPYRAEILKFYSDDKKQQLFIPFPPKTATLIWNKEEYKWSEIDDPHPKIVLFNKTKKMIIFIGGLGDPGSSLGDIYIYSLDGNLIKYIDLKDNIKNLKSLSRKWSKFSNFPWVAAQKFEQNDEILSLWICEKLKITINLKDFTITTEKNSKDSY